MTLAEKLLRCIRSTNDVNMQISTFKFTKKEIPHIVFIPWYELDGNYVNVSVGFTKYADIVHYARKIWHNINEAITDGTIYLSSCGSGREATTALHWQMQPTKAFAPGICPETRVIANRAKKYLRALLDAVYILSAEDKNNMLGPFYAALNEKIKNTLQDFPAHNVTAFNANLNVVSANTVHSG